MPIIDRTGIIFDRNLEHEGESTWYFGAEPGRYRVVMRYSDPQYTSSTLGCSMYFILDSYRTTCARTIPFRFNLPLSQRLPSITELDFTYSLEFRSTC